MFAKDTAALFPLHRVLRGLKRRHKNSQFLHVNTLLDIMLAPSGVNDAVDQSGAPASLTGSVGGNGAN